MLPSALPDLPSLGLFCGWREVYPRVAGVFFWLGLHFSVKGQSLGLPGRVHSFSQSCQPPPEAPQSWNEGGKASGWKMMSVWKRVGTSAEGTSQ